MKRTLLAVAFSTLALPGLAASNLPFEQTQFDRGVPETRMEGASTGRTTSAPRQVPSFEQYNPV